jgi:hypothetical protein
VIELAACEDPVKARKLAGEEGKGMAGLDARLVQRRLKAERQARALRTQAIMLHRRLAALTQHASHVELVAVSADSQSNRKGLAASLEGARG